MQFYHITIESQLPYVLAPAGGEGFSAPFLGSPPDGRLGGAGCWAAAFGAVAGWAPAAMDELGDLADQVQPILISVDPERDTPERMGTYVAAFDERILGLTVSTLPRGARAIRR